MDIFTDANGYQVRLSFDKTAFANPVQHVLVMPKYKDSWLLTKHSIRGLEFPGGKIELGETPEQAARREVLEETGATLNSLTHVADYEITDGYHTFLKSVFYAEVAELHTKNDYFETYGPVLIRDPNLSNRHHPEYSFIMKDDVVTKCLNYLHEKNGTV